QSVSQSVSHGYILFSLWIFFQQVYQSWLDKSTPFYAVRWAATLLLTAVYMIRVYILQ
uniref:Uncharacterized protein n=1 Tax=Seriola lalandi dorsalis TaxID=1841481 RepID=A0A3B4WLI8_SERLL